MQFHTNHIYFHILIKFSSFDVMSTIQLDVLCKDQMLFLGHNFVTGLLCRLHLNIKILKTLK